MFIMSHRNIVLPAEDGSDTIVLKRGGLCEVPERFCRTAYFAALVKDGKIVLPASRSDSDVEKAESKRRKKGGE